MDSTIAFSDIQHFLHAKIGKYDYFLISQSFSSTCSRQQLRQPQDRRQNDVKHFPAVASWQRSFSSRRGDTASGLNLPAPKRGQAPAR
ncbi:hypothetical protein CKO_03658 [Citrobacter koseri ATCC BAA-895]|uniref:Uncharacterized protein n=1 Tax=Citrobacter koseri (strain ATCC BAA-895 / CDC 4225-83 / SGSC4696) TaxID=290338 RepID=A8AMM4_CITK8|nr:hypothetical protein CKO_03658 [Citrobacter koseri ATCC BAA-895]